MPTLHCVGRFPHQRVPSGYSFRWGAGRVVCLAPGRPPLVLPGRSRGEYLCGRAVPGARAGLSAFKRPVHRCRKGWALDAAIHRFTGQRRQPCPAHQMWFPAGGAAGTHCAGLSWPLAGHLSDGAPRRRRRTGGVQEAVTSRLAQANDWLWPPLRSGHFQRNYYFILRPGKSADFPGLPLYGASI